MSATLLTYLLHYLFARAVWEELRSHGAPDVLLGAVGLAGAIYVAKRRRQ